MRDSCVHHNAGPGLWTDFDNIHTLYEGNTVFLNGEDGIKHEISYDATIRNNVVAANGQSKDNWLWGSQNSHSEQQQRESIWQSRRDIE